MTINITTPYTDVDVVGTRDATIATVRFWIDEETCLVGTGTAKKDSEDEYNFEIGSRLALGRAFDSLSKKLLRQGNGMVKCAEDNRIASEEAATKRKAAAETQGKGIGAALKKAVGKVDTTHVAPAVAPEIAVVPTS